MATCCRHPDGLGIIIGDFNISELEEGRFNGIDQTFSDGGRGQSATCRSILPYAVERLLNQALQRWEASSPALDREGIRQHLRGRGA